MQEQTFAFNVAYNSPSTPSRVNYQQNFQHVDLYKNAVRPNCDKSDNDKNEQSQKTNMEVFVDNILLEADKLHTNVNEELQFVCEMYPELIADDAAVDANFLENEVSFSENNYFIPSDTISNTCFNNMFPKLPQPKSPQVLNTPQNSQLKSFQKEPQVKQSKSIKERQLSEPLQVTQKRKSIDVNSLKSTIDNDVILPINKRKKLNDQNCVIEKEENANKNNENNLAAVDNVKNDIIFDKIEPLTKHDNNNEKNVDIDDTDDADETDEENEKNVNAKKQENKKNVNAKKQDNSEIDNAEKQDNSETDDDDEKLKIDEKKLYSFKRTLLRPKYKKNKIVNSVIVNETNVAVTSNKQQIVATENEISKYFCQEFTSHLEKFNNNEIDKFISNKRFCDYMAETSFYTFLIKKNEYNKHKYDVTYMTYTKNVCKEYANKYYLIDNRVFVVTIERCRFMVSYNLVKFFNIEIPEFQDMQEINDPKRCSFIDTVGTFKTLLIAAFELNMYYLQTTLAAKFIALGELRSSHILRKFNEMFQDSSMFTLPLVVSQDNNSESDNCELITPQKQRLLVSPYVMQIIKISKNLKYPQCSLNEFAINNLKKVVIENYSGGSLTYKYASVANLLYTNYKYNSKVLEDKNFNDNVYKNEFKSIKKEDGSLLMINYYLFQNADNENGHNFILATFKNEDRLTIIKKKELFYWIYLELQDNNAKEKINKFNKFLHHTFVISKANRRDSCVIHNHLIKLIALVVQELIPLSNAIEFAQKQLNCKHNLILST
uniref:Ie-1 n=1 Tax=Iragoides fasciata nucleopolyhedrovirus TaxID=571205 RepID=B6VC35_9ABAC|nr:Ie-1 [Iragoides fasciata nucleopolyhedrovirus]